ncbi:MAG: hypothetical protein EA384_16865 [Spirochaetaceae bacterium]|nr:MAG: hypothetical protein EA384_16865 [Spirochaetaceae bacterium]
MKKSAAFFEGIIIVAVVLVVVHFCAEELAVILRVAWQQRIILLYIGLGLDIVFTIDFLVRSYFALLRGAMGRYFFAGRGWIDLLASIPLLVLVSGPAMLAVAAGSATVAGFSRVANVIEIARAIRTGRVLRLLRLVKLVPHRRDREAAEATSRAATVAVAAVVIAGLIAGVMPIWFETQSLEERTEIRFDTIARHVDEGNLVQPAGQAMLASLVALEPGLLVVQDGDRRVYSRYSADYYRHNLGPHDYLLIESGDIGIYFDIRPMHAASARTNLTYLAIALLVVLLIRPRRHGSGSSS